MKPKIKTMSFNTSSAKSSLVSFENHYNYDATFLLHDIFGYNFDEVAEMLGKSGAACRKLTSRARAGRPRFEANMEDHKRLMESFFSAARSGDFDGLKSLLSGSVSLYSDGGGKAIAVPKLISGADVVATFFTRIAASEERSGHDYKALAPLGLWPPSARTLTSSTTLTT